MNLHEFLKITYTVRESSDGYKFQEIRPRIFCKDGNSLSVQGSSGHYSSPREDGYSFSKVEVGYPSIRPNNSWKEYSEGEWNNLGIMGTISRFLNQYKKYRNTESGYLKRMYKKNLFTDSACDTIYAYIPVELVEEFINQHGGIDETKSFGKVK